MIFKIENNECSPRLKHIKAIAQALGLAVTDLLGSDTLAEEDRDSAAE